MPTNRFGPDYQFDQIFRQRWGPERIENNNTLARYYESSIGYKTFIIGGNTWNAFDVIDVLRDLPEPHIDFTPRIFNREDLHREQQNENYRD